MTHGFDPWVRKIQGEGNGNPLQYSSSEILWTEEPGVMQSTGWQKVGQDLATEQYTYTYMCVCIYNTTVYAQSLAELFHLCFSHKKKRISSVCLYLKGNNAFFLINFF